MRIWNLTPHPMHYDDGVTAKTLNSDGMLRVIQQDRPAESIDGLATVYSKYGEVEGIPTEVAAGDVLIVSTIAGAALKGTATLPPSVVILVPDTGATCKRNEEGRIVSVSRFIRITA